MICSLFAILWLVALREGTFAELSEKRVGSTDRTREDSHSELMEQMREFDRKLQEHDSEMRALKSKLESIQNIPLAFDTPIAFTASLSSTFTGGGVDAIVPYDYVYLNHGGHYSNTGYHFTAPVRGLYWFSISEYGYEHAHVTLMVNGQRTVTGGNENPGHKHGDNVSAMLMLEAGDRVAVIKLINNSVLDELADRNGNVFSGFLYAQL